jgi:hypothetical protein
MNILQNNTDSEALFFSHLLSKQIITFGSNLSRDKHLNIAASIKIASEKIINLEHFSFFI